MPSSIKGDGALSSTQKHVIILVQGRQRSRMAYDSDVLLIRRRLESQCHSSADLYVMRVRAYTCAVPLLQRYRLGRTP